MRILVVNEFLRLVGGIESYLLELLPILQGRNHELAILCQHEGDRNRDTISSDAVSQTWCIDEITKRQALEAVRTFAPDVIFIHAIEDLALEEELIRISPSVMFVHVFRGTCISGDKTRKFPIIAPCSKPFGPGCLVQYFPRRCGGLNPLTMLNRYQTESRRLKALHKYTKVICASSYMTEELLRHGVAAETVNLFVPREPHADLLASPQAIPGPGEPWKLAFVGRMELLKGCHILIEALSLMDRQPQTIEITFVGDGREMSRLRSLAERLLCARGIKFRFTGWLGRKDVSSILSTVHLLVFPSIWPEPFGLSGIEAGIHSVPAVAFDVGGVGDWLVDGINGCLAAKGALNARSLAEAINRAIQSPPYYLQLRSGAKSRAESFSRDSHADRILKLLQEASETITMSDNITKRSPEAAQEV